MSRELGWYARRLARMTPREVAGRTVDHARQRAWSRRQVRPGVPYPATVEGLLDRRTPPRALPAPARARVSPEASAALVAAADAVLQGSWTVLGEPRTDAHRPDWFLDPTSGRRAPDSTYSFSVDHRDESLTGNVKQVWELSRHHHLTVLAAAYWCTGEEKYAENVAAQLRSWWAVNPFLSGVHWTSGIEIGIRLMSWVWVRRLLADWPGVSALFEDDLQAVHQIRWHQEWLVAFPSHGSSSNNHAVAESCGLLCAAAAFPWFEASGRWRAEAQRRLAVHLRANTFDSGVNRELATDYHRFVTELATVAMVEAATAGLRVDDGLWRLLATSWDAAAALMDVTGRPPRQGDGDEGRALVVDDPRHDPWALGLDMAAAVVGRSPWWPAAAGSVSSAVLGALAPKDAAQTTGRPASAPRVFPDAGITLLRSDPARGPEIWVRCDGGPHGFLGIAAHAHADALAIEVRIDGVEVLIDPGTYCYHGEPSWRSYFRSTLAHNTLEIDAVDQSVQSGPFMWSARADARTVRWPADGSSVQEWTGHHDGYSRLEPGLRHQRSVRLDGDGGTLAIEDVVLGADGHDGRLAFHLGPLVEVELEGDRAGLRWETRSGRARATLLLPSGLEWSAHRGESDPVLGWYSPGFGHKVPCTTLVGSGSIVAGQVLGTQLSLLADQAASGELPPRTALESLPWARANDEGADRG